MKKMSILALLIGTSFLVNAQTDIGGRLGFNIGSATVDGFSELLTPDVEILPGVTAALTVDKHLDDRLMISTGIGYKRKGFILDETFPVDVLDMTFPIGAKAETRLDYLEAPLLLTYKFGNEGGVRPYLGIGPTFAYALKAEATLKAVALVEFNVNTSELDLNRDIYNRFEVNAQAIGGIRIPYGGGAFDLGMTYTHAITDILADPIIDIQVRNRAFGMHLGYVYTIGAQPKA